MSLYNFLNFQNPIALSNDNDTSSYYVALISHQKLFSFCTDRERENYQKQYLLHSAEMACRQ